jgi:excinuclease ABC subunit B
MPKADNSRKSTLIEHGFRLPSAIHHRPLWSDEFKTILWRRGFNPEVDHEDLKEHMKPWAKTLFVSATPAQTELDMSKKVTQQVIRPTWLLDPITYVYPKSGEYDPLVHSLEKLDGKDKSLLDSAYDRDHIDTFTQ